MPKRQLGPGQQHGFLPFKAPTDERQSRANWLKLQRSTDDPPPICVDATGLVTPILAGLPGNFAIVTWTQPTNFAVFDPQNIVGPTPTTNIRITQDGLWHFEVNLAVADQITAYTEMQATLWSAATSSTGFGAAVFTELDLAKRQSKQWSVAAGVNHVDHNAYFSWRFVTLAANDLVQIRVRVYTGGADLIGCTTQGTFGAEANIPNG